MKTAGLGVNFSTSFFIGGNYIPSAFTPSSVSNLYAWFSSTDLVLAHGASVNLWLDKSPNGRNAAPYGTTAPIFATGALNGLNAVNFRTNDGLAFSGNPIPSQWTVFTVFNRTGLDSPASGVSGAFPIGFNNFRGYLGEVVLYDKILSASESSFVQLYLENRWGI